MTQLTQEQMTELVRNVVDIMDPSILEEQKPKDLSATQIIQNIHVRLVHESEPSEVTDPTDPMWLSYDPDEDKWRRFRENRKPQND
jgi:hypothetical protein